MEEIKGMGIDFNNTDIKPYIKGMTGYLGDILGMSKEYILFRVILFYLSFGAPNNELQAQRKHHPIAMMLAMDPHEDNDGQNTKRDVFSEKDRIAQELGLVSSEYTRFVDVNGNHKGGVIGFSVDGENIYSHLYILQNGKYVQIKKFEVKIPNIDAIIEKFGSGNVIIELNKIASIGEGEGKAVVFYNISQVLVKGVGLMQQVDILVSEDKEGAKEYCTFYLFKAYPEGVDEKEVYFFYKKDGNLYGPYLYDNFDSIVKKIESGELPGIEKCFVGFKKDKKVTVEVINENKQ